MSAAGLLGNGAYDAIVASHRRSGTHLLMEYLTRNFGLTVGKTHSFHDAATAADAPIIYIARDPIDVLWSVYRWFVQGQSANGAVAAVLADLTFSQYLHGEGGGRAGFAAHRSLEYDSFLYDRGQLYQPIRFWADHVRSHLADRDKVLLVRYEVLVADPRSQMERIAQHLGRPLPDHFTPIGRDEPVGWAPSPPPEQPNIDRWDTDSLALLRQEAGDVLEALGYAITASSPRPTHASRHHEVRYVSRDDHSGYAVAGRRCIEAMHAVGIDVVWEPQPKFIRDPRAEPTHETHELLASLYRPGAAVDTTVLHTMPERWRGMREKLGGGRFIGHTVWELDRMPANWRGDIHVADRLWVPTEWNRTTLRNAGVQRDLQVVPHVVATHQPADPPIDIPDDVTVFSTIAVWHPRKRPDWTVEAFARAFTKDDQVLLVVKTPVVTDGWPAGSELERMTWYQLMQVLRRYPNAPQVMLVNDEFTDQQVSGLLQRTDCYVSLSASEGWGLGVFDAATLATPVITTGFGGQLAYLGHDHPGLVPFSWAAVGDSENSPHLEPDMVWAAPDLDAAAMMMRAVRDGNSPAVTIAPTLARHLNEAYSPLAVGRHIAQLLDGLQ